MFDKTMTQDEIGRLYHATVVDETGDKVGGVGQIYLDDQTDRPTWATVKTGLFGTRETFVPLQSATVTGDEIRVPYTKAFIKDAPSVDADGHITPEEEAELYRYYHLGGEHHHEHLATETAGVVGTDHVHGERVETDRVHTDHVRTEHDLADRDRVHGTDSMVRHEEELRVGKERVAAGQVRLRKHVVTEQKTITVPVEREEIIVERTPVRPGEGTGRIAEDETVVTLHEERPVVEKEVVAKERVGLGTQTHTEERRVTETVAKEQVEVERDGHAREGLVDGERHHEGLKEKLDRDNDGRLDADDLKPRP